jgi:hypothetical protein
MTDACAAPRITGACDARYEVRPVIAWINQVARRRRRVRRASQTPTDSGVGLLFSGEYEAGVVNAT